MNGCRARVPDNGDCYQCGREVLRGEFCKEHLAIEVRGVEKEIRHAETIKTVAEHKLARLLGGEPCLGGYVRVADPVTGEWIYRKRDV